MSQIKEKKLNVPKRKLQIHLIHPLGKVKQVGKKRPRPRITGKNSGKKMKVKHLIDEVKYPLLSFTVLSLEYARAAAEKENKENVRKIVYFDQDGIEHVLYEREDPAEHIPENTVATC